MELAEETRSVTWLTVGEVGQLRLVGQLRKWLKSEAEQQGKRRQAMGKCDQLEGGPHQGRVIRSSVKVSQGDKKSSVEVSQLRKRSQPRRGLDQE